MRLGAEAWWCAVTALDNRRYTAQQQLVRQPAAQAQTAWARLELHALADS